MEGEFNKPEAPQPWAARALRLVDEPEEPVALQLKKRKLVKATEAKTPTIKGQDNFFNFMAA